MTSNLERIQSLFQERLLTGTSEAIHGHLAKGGPFMKVYDNAYEARLIEAMGEDFPGVHTLLGDQQCYQAMSAYLRENPSSHPSIRWIGRHFPAWLTETTPWNSLPMVADMAAFEWTLGLAFDAPDAGAIGLGALAEIPMDAWPYLTFSLHPSVHTVMLTHDVAPFQQAVIHDQEPEAAPAPFNTPQTWVAWRDAEDLRVRFRPMEPEEAAGLSLVRTGGNFAALCEDASDRPGISDPALTAAGFLQTWIQSGWITGITVNPAN